MYRPLPRTAGPAAFRARAVRRARRRMTGLAQATVVGALALTLIGVLFSQSPGPIAASAAALIAIVAMLWREDVPPILLLPVLYQWSEVAILPIATIWYGVPLSDLSQWNSDWDAAAYFGLAGVVALGLGLRLGSGMARTSPFAGQIAQNAKLWPFSDTLRMSLVIIAGGYVLAVVSGFAGPARTAVDQMANVKYVGIFMLAYTCLLTGRNLPVLAAVVGFDVVFGMTGFFAEFKNTILTLAVAAMAARPRLRAADMLLVAAAALALLAVAVFWSAVKSDYRVFMNRGTGAQIVAVSLEDRLGYLGQAVASVDGETIADGFDRLVRRHGYLEFLALTMDNVPAARPHENGTMLLAAVQHVTMPRFLFPWKPPLPNDTDVMVTYTGLPPLWDNRTSISLGNFTEMYIDFGIFGALLCQLALGVAIGLVVRTLMRHRTCPPLITAGLCLMAVLPAAYFGTAFPKLAAGLVYGGAIAILGQRIAVPIFLQIFGPGAPKRRRRTPAPLPRSGFEAPSRAGGPRPQMLRQGPPRPPVQRPPRR